MGCLHHSPGAGCLQFLKRSFKDSTGRAVFMFSARSIAEPERKRPGAESNERRAEERRGERMRENKFHFIQKYAFVGAL